MEFVALYVVHLIAFVLLAVVFTWMERRWPAVPGQRWWRRPERTDYAYWLLGPVLERVMLLLALPLAAIAVLAATGTLPDAAFLERLTHPRSWLAERPAWVQLLVAFVVSDFVSYWLHRAFHGRRLWSLHAIHHSATHLDWLAAVRGHPLNGALGALGVGLALIAIGVPLGMVAIAGPVLAGLAILGHANVRWDWGPLRTVFASPAFHRWHHAEEVSGVNFANFLPVWDILFGTYHFPRHLPRGVGIRGADAQVPTGIRAQLRHPFTRLRAALGWSRRRMRWCAALTVLLTIVVLVMLLVVHAATVSEQVIRDRLPTTVETITITGYRPGADHPEAPGLVLTLPPASADWSARGLLHLPLPLPADWRLSGTIAAADEDWPIALEPRASPPAITGALDLARVNRVLARDPSGGAVALESGFRFADSGETPPTGWDRTFAITGSGSILRPDGSVSLRVSGVVARLDARVVPATGRDRVDGDAEPPPPTWVGRLRLLAARAGAPGSAGFPLPAGWLEPIAEGISRDLRGPMPVLPPELSPERIDIVVR